MFELLLILVVAWFIKSELRERANRRFDTTIRCGDFCPRCGADGVVVVEADTTGALYGACGACDAEVLL